MDPIYTEHCGLGEAEIRQNNSKLTEIFSLYLNLMPNAIDADMIKELSQGCHISPAEAYAQYLAAMAGLDAGGNEGGVRRTFRRGGSLYLLSDRRERGGAGEFLRYQYQYHQHHCRGEKDPDGEQRSQFRQGIPGGSPCH